MRNSNYLHHVVATRVSFGQVGSVPIDQTPAQDFNINPHTGRPMSDIQRLVSIQNDLQLSSEFAQLQEFRSKFIDKNMSDSDALKFACPRLSQLPSEILAHRVSLAKESLQKAQARKALELEAKRIKEQDARFEKLLGSSKS